MCKYIEDLLKALQCFTVVGGLALTLTARGAAQSVRMPEERTGTIAGTVTDPNDAPVPGAKVTLQPSQSSDGYTTVANESGFFELHNVKSGTPYRVTTRADGFADWTSSEIVLEPGQYLILTGCKLRLAAVQTSVDVGVSSVQIATEQVAIEEKQRVLGIIPNFYVTYDTHPEPLTPKLKFQLALKLSTDPVTALGVGAVAGIRQAANSIDFQQGAKGYGQRFGVTAANGFSNLMIGGAILPSLLHQDPRYFYQGTGTTTSRIFHALSHAFVCYGDNGRLQPNYSSLGGDLAAAALSNAYYPSSNRGAGLVLGDFAIGAAERALTGLAQEFLFRKLTSKARQ